MFRYIILVLFAVCGLSTFAAIDLNQASQSDLQTLPGVGSEVAKAIVAGRPYKSIEALKQVKGIGEVRYPQIAPLVMVQAAAPSNTKTTTPVAQRKPLVQGERININTATLDDLQRLPGIGPAKAKEIANARPFHAPEDILRVKGIAPSSYEKIKNSISTQ